MTILKYFLVGAVIWLFATIGFAGTDENEATASQAQIIPAYDMRVFDEDIERVYQKLADVPRNDIVTRVVVASEFFLGKPVVVHITGDGFSSEFDKNPIYRTDIFDCFSYVSTILAIVESADINEFKANIRKINYRNGVVDFFHRYHFTSVDWNYANQRRNHYLRDITRTIKDSNGKKVARISETKIDRPLWYRSLSASSIKLFQQISPEYTAVLLKKLHDYAVKVRPEKSVIAYLPLDKLFDKNQQADMFLFNQIPSGAVLEIIRPDWDVDGGIGSHLDVSHMGFAIRTPQGLMYREASSSQYWKYGVRDVPLVDYLRYWLNNETVKGINIQQIL